MNRRHFLKVLGLGLPALALAPAVLARRDPMDGRIDFFAGFRHVRTGDAMGKSAASISFVDAVAEENQDVWQSLMDRAELIANPPVVYGRSPASRYLEEQKALNAFSRHVVRLASQPPARLLKLRPLGR
jgi:hypothetical protein